MEAVRVYVEINEPKKCESGGEISSRKKLMASKVAVGVLIYQYFSFFALLISFGLCYVRSSRILKVTGKINY